MILGAIIIFFLIFNSGNFTPQEEKEKKKPSIPSISIGCNRVFWENAQEVLEATVNNISNPSFEWKMNGTPISTNHKFLQEFGIGEHLISLNVTFNNQTLSAKKSIQVIDSVDGITINEYAVSKNQWGFQTMFKGKNTGVKEVMVFVDSLSPLQVNDCGVVSTKALFSGKHKWKAQYHDVNIASGTFNIKETSELKINRIEIAPTYTAGSVVKGKIILVNTGSVPITEFATNTLAVNNDYAWMGDRAKREYWDQYKTNIEPGETYEIPIQMTIPEKISGVRPSGKYTITVNVLLGDKTVDTKIVNTVVK